MAETEGAAHREPPFLRVVRGEPEAEEIAALTAVLAARARSAGRGAEQPRTVRSAWRERSLLLRRPSEPGPDAWRSSFRPR